MQQQQQQSASSQTAASVLHGGGQSLSADDFPALSGPAANGLPPPSSNNIAAQRPFAAAGNGQLGSLDSATQAAQAALAHRQGLLNNLGATATTPLRAPSGPGKGTPAMEEQQRVCFAFLWCGLIVIMMWLALCVEAESAASSRSTTATSTFPIATASDRIRFHEWVTERSTSTSADEWSNAITSKSEHIKQFIYLGYTESSEWSSCASLTAAFAATFACASFDAITSNASSANLV